MKLLKMLLNLHLFDGEGAGTGDGGAVAAVGDIEQAKPSVARKGNTRASLADVKYGIQEDTTPTPAEDVKPQAAIETKAPDTIVTSNTLDAKKAEFEKLISGDYKDLFAERTQNIINQRFKETKTLQTQVEKLSPVLDLLSSKYGVSAQDVDKLSKAIMEDDSYYEQEAIEKGLTVSQLKEFKVQQRENADLKKAIDDRQRVESSNKIYSEWMRQSQELKSVYPNFDFQKETQNGRFADILRAPGMDVRTAYEVTHRDEIIGGAMQFTAQKVTEQVVNNIKARGQRPVENGIASQASANVKTTVAQTTKKDREEISRRVQGGANIRF